MTRTYSQMIQTPWGYSFSGQYRIYKARYTPEVAAQLVKEIGNANLVHMFTTKSKKTILTVIDFSTSKVWEVIKNFKPKTAKQLTLKLL